MRREDDYCVGCDNCLHCSYERKVIVYECDNCGSDLGNIYFDGEQELCLDCLAKKHGKDLMEYLQDNYILEDLARDSYERRSDDGSD